VREGERERREEKEEEDYSRRLYDHQILLVHDPMSIEYFLGYLKNLKFNQK
jgi:hypothetical protein